MPPDEIAEFRVSDARAIEGKHGRLFLDNDANQVLHQHSGELLFSAQELHEWQLVLENRIAWLSSFGIPYLFLVPPNSHSVYPEDLPDGIVSARTRPVQQLIDHLAAADSLARLIYPLDEIASRKPNPVLYCATDTHWTAIAAFAAYQVLVRELSPLVPMHEVRESDVYFNERMVVGDLGYKFEPKRSSPDVSALVRQPRAYLRFDNRVMVRGMMVETHCPEAPPATCLVLGDSFTRQVLTFLAASFRRFVWAHIPTLDHALVNEIKPDVVVSVLNERFMIRVQHDIGAPTLRDLEREKKANGQIRPAAVPYWPHLADGDDAGEPGHRV